MRPWQLRTLFERHNGLLLLQPYRRVGRSAVPDRVQRFTEVLLLGGCDGYGYGMAWGGVRPAARVCGGGKRDTAHTGSFRPGTQAIDREQSA